MAISRYQELLIVQNEVSWHYRLWHRVVPKAYPLTSPVGISHMVEKIALLQSV